MSDTTTNTPSVDTVSTATPDVTTATQHVEQVSPTEPESSYDTYGADPLDATIKAALDDADIDLSDDAEAAPAVSELEPEPEPEKATEPEKDAKKEEDELGPATDKRGRENRIPYSRVQRIVENAKSKAVEEFRAQIAPAVQEYESRLERVGQVEDLMMNNPREFLSTLISKVPGYAELFSQLAAYQQPELSRDDLQPDYRAEDGTPVYSANKLQAILDYQAKQTEARLAERYKPVEEFYQREQRTQVLMPVIKAQLQDAMTWPGFADHQDEILKALQADKSLSLDAAYRMAVLPKLAVDRTKVREEVLREINSKPRSTAATTQSGGKTGESASLEDTIRQRIREAGIKWD